MKKIFLILLICCISTLSFSQLPVIFANEYPDSASAKFGITGNYGFDANALNNTFIRKFYTGDYIDAQTKSDILGKTKNNNRIGADANFGIFTAVKFDSLVNHHTLWFFLSVRDRQHFDGRYSDDFFKIGFYGNADYAGHTAYLSGFNYSYLHYQQLQLGFFTNKSDSTARWGIGLSVLKGEQYASITADKAELYTSQDGQYINFNSSIQYAQSDTAHKGAGAFNGIGASMDIYFDAPFKTKFGDSRIKVSVADIGFIRFNDQSLYLKQDSLFHYTGFKIHSLYDLQDSTFGSANKDSILNRIAPVRKKAFNVTLPATLNISFETRFTPHFALSEGIRYVYNANDNILAFIKGNFYLNKTIMLSATFGYGGYGNYHYGIGLVANFKNNFIVNLGCSNVIGYIAPRQTCGQGAFITLIKNFK